MNSGDLKPRQGFPELVLEIVSKAEPRKFANDRGSGQVCSCAGKDEAGEVSLSLWNEQCTQFNEGDVVKITNGWCTEYNGQLQVSTGRNGKIEKV